jgi:toxin ParE1/3/4
MSPFRLTALARRDIDDIADFTETRWGSDQMVRYLGDLDELFRKLAAAPGIGMARPDLGPGLRARPHGSHLVIYRSTETEVLIIRVVHQAMEHRNIEI